MIRKTIILIFALFLIKPIMAQDTIISISFRNFTSPYSEDPYSGAGDLLEDYEKKNFSISGDVKLSYTYFDFYAGIEYLNRKVSASNSHSYDVVGHGQAGSYYHDRHYSYYTYSALQGSLIAKVGSNLKIGLFKRRAAILPGINFGFSGRLFSKELTNISHSEDSFSSFNGVDSTYSGNSSSSDGLATEKVRIAKNLLFSDFKLGIGTEKGKFRFCLTFGKRYYYSYLYRYEDFKHNTDKFWELSIGYRI